MLPRFTTPPTFPSLCIHTPHALRPYVHDPTFPSLRVHAPHALRPYVPAPHVSFTPRPHPSCPASICPRPPRFPHSASTLLTPCVHMSTPPTFPSLRVHTPHALRPRVHAARVSRPPPLSRQSLDSAEAFLKIVLPSCPLAVSNCSPCVTSVCFASNRTNLVTNLVMNLEAVREGGSTGDIGPRTWPLTGTERPSLSLGSFCSRAAPQVRTRHPDLLWSVSFCGRKAAWGFG